MERFISKGVVRAAAVFCLIAAAPPALAADPTFFQKLRSVSPGMTRESVLAVLGEPEAVVQKSIDAYGRPVEVWRYFPGLNLPPQATLFSPDGGPVAAAISMPVTSSAADDAMSRARRDTEFWEGVQKAASSNPADANYRPVFRKVAPAPQTTNAVRAQEAYLVIFVNGVVQSVQLSNL